jgi:hypothetical protein
MRRLDECIDLADRSSRRYRCENWSSEGRDSVVLKMMQYHIKRSHMKHQRIMTKSLMDWEMCYENDCSDVELLTIISCIKRRHG